MHYLFCSVLYIALRRVLELVLLRSRSNESKELKIVVLRHQLHVLRRQVSRCSCWRGRLKESVPRVMVRFACVVGPVLLCLRHPSALDPGPPTC